MSSTKKATGSAASGSPNDQSTSTTERACVRQVRRWLAAGFTGCQFAQAFSRDHLLLIGIDGVAQPELVDQIFDFAVQQGTPGIAVFPAIRTEAQLVDQLRALQGGERWTVSRVEVPGLETDELLIGLTWRTSEGRSSLPMGFGSFPTMPVTRRAPYVCLATWPGGHDNPHRKKYREPVVDFLDAKLPRPLTADQYIAMWDESVAKTGEILAEQQDSPRFYRQVAFRLSADAAARFDLPSAPAG